MRSINLEVNYDGTFRRTPYLRQGETGTSTIYLTLPTEFQGYSYVIVFQPVTGDPISTEELTPDENQIISYVLTAVFTAEIGTIGVELTCYDESDNLVKSAEMSIEVKESLSGAGDVIPTDYVPWYVLAAQKASEAEEDASQTALDRIATGEDVIQTGKDRVATGEDRAQTALDRIDTGEDRVATGGDRSAVNSALNTFSTVTLPASVAEVEGEGDTQVARVTGEGDTQDLRVTGEGDTQVGLVQAEGVTQIGLVQAEGTNQTGLVTAEGDEQTARVTTEGDTQDLRVTTEGTTQVGLVQTAGTTQVGLVTAEGNEQVGLVESEGTTQIGLVEAEGTAQTALAGTVIYYQLATPVITENVTSGSIIAYPSGTIYSEPVIADVAVYSTSAGILNTGYPISTLESIYKIDSVTGEQTPLAVASATVASGGLSFTHSGLTAGDLVGFTYYFAYAYPHGLLTYNYIDNTRVVLGDDGKYYKITFAVASGVPSMVATEVV